MPSGNRKNNILEELFSSVLSQFKRYHPSGNLKIDNLGIFQRLKLRTLMGKILRISLRLNFTPNTLGGYGLTCVTCLCLASLPLRFAQVPLLRHFYRLKVVLLKTSQKYWKEMASDVLSAFLFRSVDTLSIQAIVALLVNCDLAQYK